MFRLEPEQTTKMLIAWLGPVNVELMAAHFRDGVPQHLLASRFGMTEPAIQKRIARCRAKLRAAGLWPTHWR